MDVGVSVTLNRLRDECLCSRVRMKSSNVHVLFCVPQKRATDECYFLEHLESNNYNTYRSRKYPNMYVALKRTGQYKSGSNTGPGQKAILFLPMSAKSWSEVRGIFTGTVEEMWSRWRQRSTTESSRDSWRVGYCLILNISEVVEPNSWVSAACSDPAASQENQDFTGVWRPRRSDKKLPWKQKESLKLTARSLSCSSPPRFII